MHGIVPDEVRHLISGRQVVRGDNLEMFRALEQVVTKRKSSDAAKTVNRNFLHKKHLRGMFVFLGVRYSIGHTCFTTMSGSCESRDMDRL